MLGYTLPVVRGLDCVLSVEQVETGWDTLVCCNWPWRNNCTPSHLPHTAACFVEEPNSNHPQATIFSTSHSLRLLAHPETQYWALRSSFVSVANRMWQQVSKLWLNRAFSNGKTLEQVCTYVQKGSTSRVTGVLYTCFTKNYAWIRELFDLPT
jgi:hypothetical protein